MCLYPKNDEQEADMSNTETPKIEHVCFTGHRNLDAAHATLIPSVLEQILRTLIRHGATNFYAGGALGFDTVAAIAVLRLKKEFPHIKLALILPCKTQTKMWGENDRAVYNAILECADSIEYVHENYTSYCMHDRNRRLVDCADLCVAYCEHNGGGTAYTMAYALKQNKEVINISDLI